MLHDCSSGSPALSTTSLVWAATKGGNLQNIQSLVDLHYVYYMLQVVVRACIQYFEDIV